MGFMIKDGVLEKYIEEDGITEVVIPEGVTKIGDRAFRFCNTILRITIPEGVTEIGRMVFGGCNALDIVDIPKSLQSVDYGMFYCCFQLKEAVFPDNIRQLGDYTFASCVCVQKIRLPAKLKAIGKYAFWRNRSLTEMTIPEGVESIGKCAFKDCRSLETLMIPDSVRQIGWGAFLAMNSLRRFVLQGISLDVSKLDADWAAETTEKKTEVYHSEKWDTFFSMLENGDYTAEFPEAFQPVVHAGVTGYFLRTEDAYAGDYVRGHIGEIMELLMLHDNPDAIGGLLEKHMISSEYIDECIGFAIAYTQIGGSPEIQTMLMHYKSDVLGYEDPAAQFKL